MRVAIPSYFSMSASAKPSQVDSVARVQGCLMRSSAASPGVHSFEVTNYAFIFRRGRLRGLHPPGSGRSRRLACSSTSSLARRRSSSLSPTIVKATPAPRGLARRLIDGSRIVGRRPVHTGQRAGVVALEADAVFVEPFARLEGSVMPGEGVGGLVGRDGAFLVGHQDDDVGVVRYGSAPVAG